MQANWRLDLQVAGGKVRTLDMQSGPYQGETKSWVFVPTHSAEPEEIVTGVFIHPLRAIFFCVYIPRVLMNAKSHQKPELGDLGLIPQVADVTVRILNVWTSVFQAVAEDLVLLLE